MHPFLFEVMGRQIPSYGTSLLLGAGAAYGLVRLLAGKRIRDISLIFLICIAGGFVGATILRPLMKIPEVILRWEEFRHLPAEVFFNYVFGEIVFYGGFLGGAAALILYCKLIAAPIIPVADVFAPALALAHGFGRIGCFLGGCCYGIEVPSSHPFGVSYPSHFSHHVSPELSYLAIQPIETVCLFTMSIILSIVYKTSRRVGFTFCLYLVLYSILRFVLEFYRGDIGRGVYGPFSTSQYISMFLLAGAFLLYFVVLRNKKASEWLGVYN